SFSLFCASLQLSGFLLLFLHLSLSLFCELPLLLICASTVLLLLLLLVRSHGLRGVHLYEVGRGSTSQQVRSRILVEQRSVLEDAAASRVPLRCLDVPLGEI